MFLRFKTCFLVAIFFILSLSQGVASSFTGELVRVIDGDTIVVLHSGKEERVRLNGIDAPERGQDFGKKAKQFLIDLAARKNVTVYVKDIDRYRRTVGEVYLESGKSLNHELVRNGFAWWYKRYSKEDVDLERLEMQAKQARKGVWQDPNPVPPWEWRNGGRKPSKGMEISGSANANNLQGQYRGNVRSLVFHRPSCKYYECKNCTRMFDDREKAINEGYKPCGLCKLDF